MKKLKLIGLFISLSLSLMAQETKLTQTIRGKIIDVDTQTPLPGAYILILGVEPLQGAVSDFDGNYEINGVEIGRKSLKVSFVGYEDIVFSQVTLSTGSELVLNAAMVEKVDKLDEIIIRPEDVLGEPINDMVSVSAQRLTVESTSRIAAGINDPGRTIQSYAGVSSVDDENNEIVVRGNSPRGMLWRMEGVEIPNPNHFSNGEGGSGGGVSALSTEVLDDSDFFSGAFAAEYGNALSSVFDLRLRNGNYEKQQYAFQIGVLGLQAGLEGPFKKGSEASYLVNYRYSTTSLINDLGFEIGDSDISPEWQDLSFNFNLPTKKAGRFNVWGLGGISSAADIAEQDSSKWEYRGDPYSFSEKHRLGIVGITHNYLLNNKKSYVKTVASYSHSSDIELEDSLSYKLDKSIISDENFNYNTITLSSFINHKFNSRNTVRVGAIYTNQAFILNARNFDYDDDLLKTEIQQTGSTNRIQSYVQWKYRINPKIDLNTGLHYTYLAISKDYAVEPRLGVKWQLNSKHSLSYGFGLHSKAEAASIYTAQQVLSDGTVIHPNEDLKMSKAVHNVIGYNWNMENNFHFKAEVYYQNLYDIPIQVGDTTGVASALNFSSGFTNENFTSEGTGRNYGIELTLEKGFSSDYYLMATTSLFESKYKMQDGIEKNTFFNSKYIYNLIGGKEFYVGKNKQNIVGLNIRGMLRGGYRTIPVDFLASESAGEDVRDYSRAYETKAPDYFRIDAGISFRKNMPNWSWIVSLDIQNITARQNVYDDYYQVETNTVEPIYMVGLLPIANFKVEF